MTNIALLLTCHNRCDKTCASLSSFFEVLDKYNTIQNNSLQVTAFLTDDGCTDGTADAVRQLLPNRKINILQGDGNLYWAGGMRFAWNEALKRHAEWDYYLLINDDVVFMDNVFDELFAAQDYAKEHYGKEGICSGITCAKDDPQKLTYGGSVWVNRLLGKSKKLYPVGVPQNCDLTNANILFVPNNVVNKIGILYKGYKHAGDYDYSHLAKKKGFPVLITANFCGKCEYDHRDFSAEKNKIIKMNLKQRIKYYRNPVHCIHDQLLGEWRKNPYRIPFVFFGRMINLFFPRLYYRLSEFRDNK